jgi:DNA polymerase-4
MPLVPTELVPRAILHLDGDAFFASLEQRDDAQLRGKPVAVGTGVVASCSYEARRFGVRTGMRLTEARWRCHNLIVVPGEYLRYEQAARQMMAICQERTPLVEAAALDDLYLDITEAHALESSERGFLPECANDSCQPGLFAPSEKTPRCPPAPSPESSLTPLARELRTQIRDEISLSVSIGIGTNKLVAKVATKQAKPGREVCVLPGTEREYLAPWPARVLPGAGRKIGDRLEQLNIQRVHEVAAMPVPILRGLFGNQGRVLHEQSLGIDHRQVEAHKPPLSVSRRTSFDPPSGDRSFLRAMLNYLLERAGSWLRFQQLAARAAVVTIRYGDYQTAEARTTFPEPTDRDSDLQLSIRDCFERLYQRRLPLRLLGVMLAPLVPPDRRPGLFPDLTHGDDADRARRLAECKDAVRRRFGFTALLSGSALQLADGLDRDRENFRLRTPCLTR